MKSSFDCSAFNAISRVFNVTMAEFQSQQNYIVFGMCAIRPRQFEFMLRLLIVRNTRINNNISFNCRHILNGDFISTGPMFTRHQIMCAHIPSAPPSQPFKQTNKPILITLIIRVRVLKHIIPWDAMQRALSRRCSDA